MARHIISGDDETGSKARSWHTDTISERPVIVRLSLTRRVYSGWPDSKVTPRYREGATVMILVTSISLELANQPQQYCGLSN